MTAGWQHYRVTSLEYLQAVAELEMTRYKRHSAQHPPPHYNYPSSGMPWGKLVGLDRAHVRDRLIVPYSPQVGGGGGGGQREG